MKGFWCVISLKLLDYTNITICNLCCFPRVMKKRLNQQSLDHYGMGTRTKNQCGKIKGNTVESKVVSLESVALDVEESEKKQAHTKLWQDAWLTLFKSWLIYDEKKVRLFCSYCMEYPRSKSAYSKKGSKNLKTSNLLSHA